MTDQETALRELLAKVAGDDRLHVDELIAGVPEHARGADVTAQCF